MLIFVDLNGVLTDFINDAMAWDILRFKKNKFYRGDWGLQKINLIGNLQIEGAANSV
jgi:hypothetical protein